MTDGDPFALVVEAALQDVVDPETGIPIVDLGLVYDVGYDRAEKAARVVMTLTTRACPMGEAMVEGVRRRLLRIDGVERVDVEVTFDPPWTPDRISDEGRARLGW